MNKDQIIGIIRHALSFIGALLVGKGVIDDFETSELIIGSTIALVSLVWSLVDKKETNIINRANAINAKKRQED